MTKSNKIKVFGVCSAVLLLAGCGTSKKLPDLQQRDLPAAFTHSSPVLQLDTTANIAELPYQAFFQDKYLLALIDSGLNRNNNMQVALKQIEIAQEALKQVKWGYLPTASLSVGTANITRPSNNSMNGMMASQFLGKSYMEDYSTTLTVAWEADIWGKIKSQKAGALAGYLQTQEAMNTVRTGLIAGIAQGYYNLLMFDQQKVISEQNLAILDSTLQITKVQQRLGLTNSLAVQQLENSRDNLSKAIRIIDENSAVQQYALHALTGRMPSNIGERGRLTEIEGRSAFATGVPAELVSRRPDVKQAEFAFLRSVTDVKVARANMYPALRITAQGGLNAFVASNWFNVPGSLFALVSGSITQPILQGRQLKTAYNQAGIRVEQTELQFKESVLQAVTEVSTILEKISSLQDQQDFNDKLVQRNQELIHQAKILFKNDMATYLEILAAQQSKLQAELDQMMVKSQLLYAEVALYRALGGGVQ